MKAKETKQTTYGQIKVGDAFMWPGGTIVYVKARGGYRHGLGGLLLVPKADDFPVVHYTPGAPHG